MRQQRIGKAISAFRTIGSRLGRIYGHLLSLAIKECIWILFLFARLFWHNTTTPQGTILQRWWRGMFLPSVNLRMMSTQEDCWNTHPFYLFWSCILRMFNVVTSELRTIAFFLSTCCFFDHSWQQSTDCFDYNHRGYLSSKRHEFSQGEFVKIVFVMFFAPQLDTMIDTLISPTKKHDMLVAFCQWVSNQLIEVLRSGAWHNYRSRDRRVLLQNKSQRIKKRWCFHQQPNTTTIHLIIYLTMFVVTKISRIDKRKMKKSVRSGFFDKRRLYKRLKQLRKYANKCIMHRTKRSVRENWTDWKKNNNSMRNVGGLLIVNRFWM